MRGMKLTACLLVAMSVAACGCGTPGLARMEEHELFFGGSVAEPGWQGFAETVLTPAFPAGFTVYAAAGQWRSPGGTVVHERTRVVQVFGPVAASGLAHVVEAYKQRFSQVSVGVVSRAACAAF